MADLKPCPFCGEQPTDEDIGSYFVQCPECGVEGPYGSPDAKQSIAIEAWNRRAAPVQAEQSLEVVADLSINREEGFDLLLTATIAGMCLRDGHYQLTDHAKATAALAQKGAEIERLTLELMKANNTKIENSEAALMYQIADLRAQLAEAEKDAQSWRQYQARKQAIIAAGMGKNPLRDAALSSPAQARTHDQG